MIDEVVGRLELIVLLGDCDDGIFLLFDYFEVGLEEAFLIAAVVVLHIQCNINYEMYCDHLSVVVRGLFLISLALKGREGKQ